MFTIMQLVGMLRGIASGMRYLSDMGYVHRVCFESFTYLANITLLIFVVSRCFYNLYSMSAVLCNVFLQFVKLFVGLVMVFYRYM